MIKSKQLLFGARQSGGGLYTVALRTVVTAKAAEVNVLSPEAILQLYHERMRYQNKCHVNSVIQEEFGDKVDVDNEICKGCIYGKFHRLSCLESRK